MLNTFRIVVALVPIASTLLMNRPPVPVASMMPELVIGSGTLMVSAFAEFALMVPPLTRINGVEPSPIAGADDGVVEVGERGRRADAEEVVATGRQRDLTAAGGHNLPAYWVEPPAPPPTPWRLMVPLLLTTGA